MDEIGWGILEKLNKFPTLSTFKNLRNRRGEFDLLQFKNLITAENTNYRLVRGNMIGNEIDYTKQQEFVKITDFEKAKSNDFLQYDFKKKRLVCQQISNTDTKKRLKFVECTPNDVLANSCNYITSYDISQLQSLKILLNSYILNWRFKITSTNNHINNYELDALPLIDFTRFSTIMNGNELKNNIEISKLYGLTDVEIIYLLSPFFTKNEITNLL